jgi:hypothetical protein
LEPDQNGSGVFTIASPNSNTSRTLNLPDAAGTVSVADSNGIISANGIAFPATQSASANVNTLDDYEEGTWTGTLTGGTTAPSTPVTTSGNYTKIGNLVHVAIQFNSVNTTGATGQIRITGLPFTSSSVSTTGSGWSERADTTLTVSYVGSSGTTITYLSSVGSALNWLSAGSGTFVGAAITYITS